MREREVPRLLAALGIKAQREGSRWVASCPNPNHPHPLGKVSTPSWSMVADGADAGSHHCFGGCGLAGGPWELVAVVRGLPLKEAGEWVRKELGGHRAAELADVPKVRIIRPEPPPREMRLPPGVRIPSVDGSEWFPPAWDYLTQPVPEDPALQGAGPRGVADWQVARWHIGYAVTGRCAFRVVMPVYTRGMLWSYVARSFIGAEPKYDVARGKGADPGARPHAVLFGEPGWDPSVDVAVLTEGIFGALAFERAAAPNPTAILGASNLGPEKIDMLSGFRLLLVATDPDHAGDQAYAAIHDALCRWTTVRRIHLVNKPDVASDDELRYAWQSALRGRRRVCRIEPPPSVL